MTKSKSFKKITHPGPESKKVISVIRELEGSGTRTFVTDPPTMVLKSAKGAWLKDPDGNEYLDLFGGYAVANVGHSHPKVIEAVCAQAHELIHCTSAFCNPVRADLLLKIAEIAPKDLNRILLGVTGTQANEIAFNLSTTRANKKEIIAFHGGYFGRSNAMVAISGNARSRVSLGIEPRAHFVPYPYCYRCSFGGCENPDGCKVIDYIDEMLSSPASGVGNVAAIFIEPILGSGGVVVPPTGFFKKLSQVCKDHDVLLVLDEIQVGFGRTGRMWASEHDGIVPDLMTIGKGIGGGLPVSAVLGREELMTFWEPDIYTTTFLTNPLIHSAAIAAIEVMQEEKIWQNSAELGKVLLSALLSELEDHSLVGEIRGKGLFVGIEMVKDKKKKTPAKQEIKKVQSRAKEMGLIVGIAGYYGNVIRICPPLTISRSELETALEKLIYIFKQM